MRRMSAALAAAALLLGGTACGQNRSPDPDSPDHGRPTVVASTDVWAGVARAVTGEHARVDAIVSGPQGDPHSYEASPADAAKLTDATLVVYNGGHYDHWVGEVLENHPDVPAVDAYALTRQPVDEHVFYDVGTAKAVAQRIADHLAEADPAHADDYRDNAAEFGRSADALLAAQRALGRDHPDTAVVATEPVASALLSNAGIADRTPPGYAAAAAEGDDPAPADIAAMLDLVEQREVAAVLVNPQAETTAGARVADAARDAGITLVTVTETLPEGTDYLTWQREITDALATALARPVPATR